MNAVLAAEIQRLSPAEKLLPFEERQDSIAKESNAIDPLSWHAPSLFEDAASYNAPRRGHIEGILCVA